jgi:hypothetical protein
MQAYFRCFKSVIFPWVKMSSIMHMKMLSSSHLPCLHSLEREPALHICKDVPSRILTTSILRITVYTVHFVYIPDTNRVEIYSPSPQVPGYPTKLIFSPAASSRLPTELPYCHSIPQSHTSTVIDQLMAHKLLLLQFPYNALKLRAMTLFDTLGT